jgi:hypothetical protein
MVLANDGSSIRRFFGVGAYVERLFPQPARDISNFREHGHTNTSRVFHQLDPRLPQIFIFQHFLLLDQQVLCRVFRNPTTFRLNWFYQVPSVFGELVLLAQPLFNCSVRDIPRPVRVLFGLPEWSTRGVRSVDSPTKVWYTPLREASPNWSGTEAKVLSSQWFELAHKSGSPAA